MSGILPNLIAFTLLLAITAYSTAGGVDFGAGIWDLLAGGSPRGLRARALVDHAMAPVWEVNNVWLVLAIVLCWTGFPALFQATFAAIYPLFALALAGLVLRGAFFAFRHVADTPREHRLADIVFGVSSVLTPFFFAASLGAIASGKVGSGADVIQASFNPISIAFGLVSVAATAFSGASFLVGDARRYGAAEMIDYFRRRAVIAAIVLIGMGTIALVAIGFEAPSLARSMLFGPGLLFALVTMVLTPVVVFLLIKGVYRWYRTLTVAAVGSMVFAWGFAQSPYLLPGKLTIAQASAPIATQFVLLVVAIALVVLVLPSMGLLYYLDQRSVLDSTEG
ncbi:MAG TPA: cytochrome d ubiquinol oxidase subunit II [Candidatus Dormibacteraeota bacterium]|nr:cytochrome d ubiquinol oxidase subunit II [Candidatus Dormibacteraeota bacterium]